MTADKGQAPSPGQADPVDDEARTKVERVRSRVQRWRSWFGTYETIRLTGEDLDDILDSIAALTARLAAADAQVAELETDLTEMAKLLVENGEKNIALTAERDAALSLAETARGVALEEAAKVAEERAAQAPSIGFAAGAGDAAYAIRALAASGEAHER